MRKFAVLTALLVIAAWPVLAQTPASNGPANYHYNVNMNCSDCHSMHASAHDNLGDGSAITVPYSGPFGSAVGSNVINPYYPAPNPGPGRAKLLKNDDVCASCHDNQTFAPDVIGDNVNGYVRSAGGTRTAAGTGGGHLIGSTNNAPGYDGTVINYFPAGSTLECTSCHSPHGSALFRNLVPYQLRSTAGYSGSNMAPTFNKSASFDVTRDVNILNGDSYVFGSGNLQNYYGRGAITYAKSGTYTYNGGTSSNRLDQFCGICHGAFHGGAVTDGTVGNGTDFVRHPTGVVTIGSFSTAQSAANLKVYQAAGTPSAATDSPGCLTCHKAHGNKNPFALIYPSWTAADTTEEGGGEYKSLCKSCHGMGGSLP